MIAHVRVADHGHGDVLLVLGETDNSLKQITK